MLLDMQALGKVTFGKLLLKLMFFLFILNDLFLHS